MTVTKSNLRGHIDNLNANLISGWVESINFSEKHRIYCLDCDVTVLSFEPNLLREDVGLIDNNLKMSGFSLSLSDGFALKHSNHRFIIRQNEHSLLNEKNRFANFSDKKTVYVYVCELFDFLVDQQYVTGIQRYVLDFIEDTVNTNNVNNISFIAFNPVLKNFYSVNSLLLNELILDYSLGISLSPISRKIQESAVVNVVNIRNGDVFFSAGALWGVPDSYESISALVKRGVAFIPFIYDLIPALDEEMHSADKGVIIGFSKYLNFCCKNASYVCHLSKQTQSDFDEWTNKYYGIELPSSVFGAIPKTFSTSDKGSLTISELKGKKYILQVGTIEPRKCHELTLKTFSSISNSIADFDFHLVFVGRKGWKMDSNWEIFENAFGEGRVHHLTDLSDDQLHALYSEARFSVFPSKYEGWGLPICESLLNGTPCLVRKSGSMIEAGGEFATYFKDDVEFAEIFKQMCITEDYFVREKIKAKKYTTVGIKTPLSHFGDVLSISHQKSFSPSLRLKTSYEYCFRKPAVLSEDGGYALQSSPFCSKNPTQESFLTAQMLLTNHIVDERDSWMVRDSELNFTAPKNTRLFLMFSLFTESAGTLRIKFNGGYCERLVVTGMNLVSFELATCDTGSFQITFRNTNLKIDSRMLEISVDSLFVTTIDDHHVRELALHNWLNAGKQLAQLYRS